MSNDPRMTNKLPGLKIDTDSSTNVQQNPEISYLKSIDDSLKKLLKDAGVYSQSSAKDSMPRKDDFRDKSNKSSTYKNSSYSSSDGFVGQFLDSFEDSILEGFLGSNFKDDIGSIFDEFAKTVGVDLKDVPKEFGKELGNQAMSAFKGTNIGKKFTDGINNYTNNTLDYIKQSYQKGVNKYNEKQKSGQSARSVKDTFDGAKDKVFSKAKDFAKNPVGELKNAGEFLNSTINKTKGLFTSTASSSSAAVASSVGTSAVAGGAGAALSGLASAAASAAVAFAPVIAGMIALEIATEALAPAIEGASALFKSLKASGNRYEDERKKNLELASKRLEADVKSIIEAPFNILKEAATEVYKAWDENLRLIAGTQGYTKSDLQLLLSVYSQRLRDEGLTNVVSGVDITESLAKVLDSGLSGKAAEEFAYIATILNAAIPNQDFFGYADSYVAIASNAIKAGKNQTEALKYANEQLELFASDVLYSSRQLSGGFTTGLKNAQDLFDKSVQIAQASKTGKPSEIAGVLTAVSSVTGSIAPDLVSSMTDVIVKAATGGNSSDIVALRSLAGVNASNTEFLRQLANDPKKIFSTLFANLANLQNMSEDNYMEVAEGLSQIFGISMDAFSRIDFNYLANAISDMNVSAESLQENMKHLASGETTTSAEQLRMQQINKYLIDEGLSYVMDNEVARSIQEHMWDEQLAREIQESTYAVELQGAALTFLEGIRQTVDNIVGIFTGKWLTKKLLSIAKTSEEQIAQTKDIKKILELGKVGNGNNRSLLQLTTRNVDLQLIPEYIELLGGESSKSGLASRIYDDYMKRNYILGYGVDKLISNIISSSIPDSSVNKVSSKYSWNTVGKSTMKLLNTLSGHSVGNTFASIQSGKSVSNSDSAKARVQSQIDKMLEDSYINKFVEEDKSYEDWAKSAKNFGISDLSSALEDIGYSEESVKARFQSAEVSYAAKLESDRYKEEEEYWKTMTDYTVKIIEWSDYVKNVLDKIYVTSDTYLREWMKYFVEHEVYNKAFTTREQVKQIQAQEKAGTEDAIYALAEALSANSIDLLKDPTLQTNALLGQILLVVNAIMQQNNKLSTGGSLPDTLSALSMGLIQKT